MYKLGKSLLIMLFVFICISITAAYASEGEKPVIYVSGAADLGMVEYYDSELKQYKGYLPALLDEFSVQYGYDIRYLSVGNSDKREEKLNNIQADMVTAASFDDFYSQTQWDNGITVLTAEFNGVVTEYRLIFTQAASTELRNNITAFMSAYPELRSDGLLLNAWVGKQSEVNTVFRIASAVFTLIVIVLLLVIAGLKRKLIRNSLDMETDPATGFGNELYLHSCYSKYIAEADRVRYTAVYFMLSHDAFDMNESADSKKSILLYFAQLLSDNTLDNDVLARVDENGFLVLKTETNSSETADWVQRILVQMDSFLERNQQKNYAYAGIYPLHSDNSDIDSIISNASYSSRCARKSGCRYMIYSDSVVESIKEEKELRTSLSKAFDEDRFIVYLQFFIDGTNGSILGAEALSRWNHPTKGILSPKKYIELIDSENRSEQFDFIILEKVCALLEDMCSHDNSFFISCNFMRKTIAMPDFAARFKNVIDRYSFPRECLIFEITELGVIENSNLLYSNIAKIKEFGIRTVIDDFGNGYSDIFDMGHFIYDGVKLDSILVSENASEKEDIILSGMLRIFKQLGVTVIAEGIESQGQADRLLRLGCMIFQGYHYYLPMPASEAKRIFTEERSNR